MSITLEENPEICEEDYAATMIRAPNLFSWRVAPAWLGCWRMATALAAR